MVDNNSTGNTFDLASKTGVLVLKESKQGTTSAKNNGANFAGGEYLVFLDADCRMPSDHLKKVKRIIEINGHQAIAGSFEYYDAPRIIKYLMHKTDYIYHYFKFVELVFGIKGFTGGNFVINKNVYEGTGGFDNKIKDVICPDDIEYSIRLGKQGVDIYFSRDLVVDTSYRRVRRSIFDPLRRLFCFLRIILNK